MVVARCSGDAIIASPLKSDVKITPELDEICGDINQKLNAPRVTEEEKLRGFLHMQLKHKISHGWGELQKKFDNERTVKRELLRERLC